MLKNEIVSEITVIVSGDYGSWYIGVTADPEQRRISHGNPPSWRAWNAGLESEARYIEKFFLFHGMQGDTGGGYNPTYVYIYKR